MNSSRSIATAAALGALLLVVAALPAQEPAPAKPSGDVWTRTLTKRSERGLLSDLRETVRGDSGKWNDEARLQHVSGLHRKPSGKSLDDWTESQAAENIVPTSNDDHWLVLRTRQLDDNDRVWIERIERRGREFVIVLNHAVWRGRYSKNFTFYQLEAVNLGPLPPGSYKAKWIIQTLDFTRYEDPGQPKDNWPKNERPSTAQPVELTANFTVAEAAK